MAILVQEQQEDLGFCLDAVTVNGRNQCPRSAHVATSLSRTVLIARSYTYCMYFIDASNAVEYTWNRATWGGRIERSSLSVRSAKLKSKLSLACARTCKVFQYSDRMRS